ncbi:hypothetical protein PYW08_009114 [Mythimna loreyi]|uniref:Uncharacterized protein n=1 Tax=Mythimna loreyi TaxID=667449 RepID=A0ACC2Q7U4_9NEOP|nr:hypothetical protein PYW08_009114 [Mythimna loreyi]
MPRTQRSPPATPVVSKQRATSSPDISTNVTEVGPSNVTARHKRFCPDFSPEQQPLAQSNSRFESFENKIVNMLTTWKQEQDAVLNRITSDINEMEQTTLGTLTEWTTPAKEEKFFKNIINLLDEVYPENWRDWVINITTYKDLFGESISSDTECRLRFAIPTVKLAKAYSPEHTLSERRYKKIKRILLTWPLGRALIYAPLAIMAKIHPVQAYNKFSETINKIKVDLVSRQEADVILREGHEPESISVSGSSRASKRSHSPDAPTVDKEPRLSDFMAHQNLILEKLCTLAQTTNDNVRLMLNRENHANSVESSQGPWSPSLHSDHSDDEPAADDTWNAPPIIVDPLGSDRTDIEEEPLQDFTPGTKETEAKITKADEVLVKQGIDCQRFGSEGWKNIRYAEVQKTFQATPAFTALKVNSNLATVTPSWQLVSVLEKMDLCLGAITHGLLLQRQTFQEIYQDAPASVKAYISKQFLGSDSSFRKVSDSLLQYTCGKRSEVIQQRRGIYKPQNKIINELLHAIPPSESHLFAEPQLSELEKRYPNNSIPRRFFNNAHESRGLVTTDPAGNANSNRSGMECKSKQVSHHSNKCNRIFRSYMEYRTKLQMPPEAQSSKNYYTSKRHTREKMVDVAQSKNYTRKHRFCVICCSVGKAPHQGNTKAGKFTPRDRQKQEDLPSKVRPERTSVVVGSYPATLTNSPHRPHSICNDRCIRSRMGSHSKRLEFKRPMDIRATIVAQQSERTVDFENGSSESSTHLQMSNNIDSNGQQICGSIYHQRRRDKVLKSIKADDRYTGVRPSAPNTSDSSLPPGKIQSPSRQPLEIPPNTRMDTVEGNNTNHIQQMGHTVNRPFRELSISGSTTIRKRRCTRSSMHIRECLQQKMALRPRLAFSSTSTDTSSITPSREKHGNLPICDTELGENLLESGIETTSAEPSVLNTRFASPPDRSENGETSTSSREPTFAGMEGTGWTGLVETWQKESKTLLESAWRKSTLKTYKIAWERWRLWSRERCQTNDPEPGDLSKFICYLHNEVKLAPRTIAVHKSVVATFANPEKSEELARHPLVNRIMKAIATTRPPPRKPSTWQAASLIEYLQHYSINVESLFQISRHVTAILLLCTGRRVHDLTLLDISPEFFENNGDHVILWPKFGSKTDSATHRQSGWRLSNNGPERLNPVLWIEKLIIISQERRKARQNLNSLFITTRGKVNAASRTVIAGWIKTLFREANIQDSPGSFRAAVNSDIWVNRNINIDELLERGNWRSKDTFLKHYFKEVHIQNRDSTGANLTDLFSPV